mmetsp:Transcript_6569/g.17939  ORF Transcript_6569/g.17939 Transcript_6569/m.17939 type:complete len:106 (+) Transcript_6569:1123-1440(+)
MARAVWQGMRIEYTRGVDTCVHNRRGSHGRRIRIFGWPRDAQQTALARYSSWSILQCQLFGHFVQMRVSPPTSAGSALATTDQSRSMMGYSSIEWCCVGRQDSED